MKQFYVICLAALIMLFSCKKIEDKIDKVTCRVDNLEERVLTLEELCKQMNTNISSLQSLVYAIQQKDFVSGVAPITKNGIIIGYTISFTKSDPITIYHGQNGKDGADGVDGKDGHTPIIGVKQYSDGIYYWTVDGEWLTDNSGNKVKAIGTDGSDGKDGSNGNDGADGINGNDGKDGVTPQLKIEEDYWYISYDNGSSWRQLGKATGEKGNDGANGSDGKDGIDGKDGADGDSIFSGIDYTDTNFVIFTLSDGTEIKLPTWYSFEQLQILCNQMNTNISSLQTIVTALQNQDYVKGTAPLMENGKVVGYTITFNKSGSITIYHGQNGKDGADGVDGKDGHTPIIGVKQYSDGIYYWTVDGEWLTDESGNKVKAIGTDGSDGKDGSNGNDGADGINGNDGKDGVTPQLKIEGDYWYISYDNGSSWKQLGKATGEKGNDGANGSDGKDGIDGKDGVDGDSIFSSIDYTDTNFVIFTLSDGTEIKLPTWYSFEQLQILCNQMNTNISSLQTIVTALQNQDYVKSTAPLMENGKVVGYTITFSKSGSITIYHGQNGKDGADGVDGKDGHTPIIGVKQYSDGIYYWTVDGEWLTDESGNKVKAIGTDGSDGKDGSNGNDGADGINGNDGKDGVTPQLKIEGDYWYISYDNGSSWKQLGKATGEKGNDGANGSDGKDGDSLFKNITEDENNVYFILTDGTTFTLPKTSSYIFNRVQSVYYIPRYSDGKATVVENTLEMDFQICPKSAVKDLATNWHKILSLKAVSTITRAVNYIDMPILSLASDETNGIISINASADNLNQEFFVGTQEASVTLLLSDGKNEISSAYIPIIPYHPYNEIWYRSDNSTIISPAATNAFGANIISNTYDNNKGVIRFDGVVTIIGKSAFSGKSNLLNVVLPESITTIGDKAFSNCSNLNIVIPQNVASFGSFPFENCGGKVTINCNIPSFSTSTSIFRDFSEIIIGDSVTTIGDYAFSSNPKISKISLPETTTSIGKGAFYECTSLTTISIPENVTSIGDDAFFKCTSLTSISIPNNISTISRSCFSNCSSLSDVVIGKGVSSIQESAFSNCKSLKNINIPNNVSVIGRYVFQESGLTEATIGSGITSIGVNAFDCNKIYCKAITPPAIELQFDYYSKPYSGFGFENKDVKIYVPSQSYDLYTQYTSYKGDSYQPENWALYRDKIIAYDFD